MPAHGLMDTDEGCLKSFKLGCSEYAHSETYAAEAAFEMLGQVDVGCTCKEYCKVFQICFRQRRFQCCEVLRHQARCRVSSTRDTLEWRMSKAIALAEGSRWLRGTSPVQLYDSERLATSTCLVILLLEHVQLTELAMGRCSGSCCRKLSPLQLSL